MKMVLTQNYEKTEVEVPQDFISWVLNQNPDYAFRLELYLEKEMIESKFNCLDCLICLRQKIAFIGVNEFKNLCKEGSRNYFIMDSEGSDFDFEEARFFTHENMKGWAFEARQILTLEKAISIIRYVITNLAYPEKIKFEMLT
jgi:hypothetical protein